MYCMWGIRKKSNLQILPLFSSLELPYKTKLEADRELENTTDSTNDKKKPVKMVPRVTKPKGESAEGERILSVVMHVCVWLQCLNVMLYISKCCS